MTIDATSPARNEVVPQNQRPEARVATSGDNWQQQIEEMLLPAITPIQQQVVRAAEQQLEPLRSRIQQLIEQQLAGSSINSLHLDQKPRQTALDGEGPASNQGEGARQKTASSPSQSLVQTLDAEAPSPPVPEGESPLQRWGGTLEDFALILLAVGEVLDGIALILQAIDEMLPPRSSSERAQDGESAYQAEQKGKEQEAEMGGEFVFQKLGHVFSTISSFLSQAVSRLLRGGSSAKPGLEDMVASLPQWGRILGHTSALLQALGDRSSSKQEGVSSLKRWEPIVKHGSPLVKELSQVLGSGLSSQQGDGGIQRWGQILGRAASVLEVLGDGSSQKQDEGQSTKQERKGDSPPQQEQESDSSSKQEGGGISSALQSLAGGSSSQKKDGGGSSLLDALTGESSPLQMLREFSKRQQGPAGLAPKGPVGRKPPPGPLRRDRLPDTR